MYSSYDQPYEPPQQTTVIYPAKRRIDWKTLGAYALAAIGVGFGIACLLLFVGYKNTVSGQMSQLSRVVQHEQSARASGDKSLNGKIAATDNAVGDFAQFKHAVQSGPHRAERTRAVRLPVQAALTGLRPRSSAPGCRRRGGAPGNAVFRARTG